MVVLTFFKILLRCVPPSMVTLRTHNDSTTENLSARNNAAKYMNKMQQASTVIHAFDSLLCNLSSPATLRVPDIKIS